MSNTEEKQEKLRSRAYPRYDLEESIKFVESVQKLGGNRVSNAAVAAEVGKAVTNSGFTGRVSSAKQFGLLSQESGKLSVSSLAKQIFIPKGNVEKETAIRTAFSSPELYKEIITGFAGKIVPEQSVLANLLYHDYKIETAAKDSAARNFLRSAHFAEVFRNGILVMPDGENSLASMIEEEDIINPELEDISTTQQIPTQKPRILNLTGQSFHDNGKNWSITIQSEKPLNSETKKKLIEVAELLDMVNNE